MRLSEGRLYTFDMAHKLHFAVRKVSLTFPLRQPAQLDLVLIPSALKLPA